MEPPTASCFGLGLPNLRVVLEEVHLFGRVLGVEGKEYGRQSLWVSATLTMVFGEPESVLPGLQLVEYKDSPWPGFLQLV